jgi:3-isopropylmalate/(R)-2-methylmalate dehydratase small subunit
VNTLLGDLWILVYVLLFEYVLVFFCIVFVLNQTAYRNAEIIIAGENFGCGSSREHAPWALKDFGISVVISESFADIFYSNCFKNGILPIKLSKEAIDILMDDASKGENARISVDLEEQTVSATDGTIFKFEVDAFKKHCLLNGLDDIGLTYQKIEAVDQFEKKQAKITPWL